MFKSRQIISTKEEEKNRWVTIMLEFCFDCKKFI